MRTVCAALVHGLVGTLLALLSTFVGERSAWAIYPDIMGCETGCSVVATGWPMTFVNDYLGMSVVHTANIMEVWFAADRFAWPMFLVNAVFWTLISLAAEISLRPWRAKRR